MLFFFTAFCFAFTAVAADCRAEDTVTLIDLSQPLPEWAAFYDAAPCGAADSAEVPGLPVCFDHADWPQMRLEQPGEVWDWSAYAGVGLSLYNPTDEAFALCFRLDNPGTDGTSLSNRLRTTILPGQHLDFTMRFVRKDGPGLWGMRGLPGTGQYGEGTALDLTRISSLQIFLPNPERSRTLILKRWFLFGHASDAEEEVPLPFIDRFGQYKHAGWRGKVTAEEELRQRLAKEREQRMHTAVVSGYDRFGGWADGPRREATGWFRTEKIDGQWWLITPEGSLFFSLGVDCVGYGERTFVEQRESWFDWLPGETETPFCQIYTRNSGAHSYAEPIGGEGRTFSFYQANLMRKYGDSWQDDWRSDAVARLRCWGFNTIGNWSHWDILRQSEMPFVVSSGFWGIRLIERSRGYWSKMQDVYDESFPRQVEKAVAGLTEVWKNNPFCIGYFFDNELAWEGVQDGVLSSGAEQPARQAFIAWLQERYSSPDQLNRAWAADFGSWDDVQGTGAPTQAFTLDMSDFLHHFALRYFTVIQETVKRHDPNHLYLVCRLALAHPEVVRACSETADVLSFNLYYNTLPANFLKNTALQDKPVIIGEFHFGALDRGMFHTGLVGAKDQKARGRLYRDYVESVLAHPSFIGCHWFQWVDEPVTGRWMDGENYNLGFVDVTDSPYPELTEAAKEVHSRAYTFRASFRNESNTFNETAP